MNRLRFDFMEIDIPNLKQILLDTTGLDEKESAIIATMTQAQLDLLTQNWSQIKAIREKDPKAEVSISLSSSVNTSGPRPKLITKIKFAQKFDDEREDYIGDTQEQMRLN